ncbi:pgl: 6-phosphogluconolactonase [Gaiella occulta]|uniref:6-phosphogluconolactonase n=1 Tax=Gaiella occulta TaxID=1002870 RepID=A0A7M2YY61_9ACTN|nr:6-phosphogluconolactonase [Gaiella occulta]RDI74417.1 pgl: 6-phosphogluconolactonase [Gaiella occulta]
MHASADVELVVVPGPEEAAAAAADVLARSARAGGSIVLAGGTTPRRAYELAAAACPDWGSAQAWFGDERCVARGDPRSNELLVRRALLDRLAVPPTVHAVPTELSPAAAAAAYDRALRGVRLDLALLGLGADGHTASLFPNAPSLTERDRLAVAAAPGLPPPVERVTMTIPALASAGRVVFLATGTDKADAARRAFAEPPSPATPASLVRSARGTTTAILDEAAAALLPIA